MSTATAAGATAGREMNRGKGNADELIGARISEACAALWWAELIRAALRLAIVLIICLLAWVVIDQWIYSPGIVVRTLALAGLVGWTGWSVVYRLRPILGSSIRPEYAARSLEHDLPTMRQTLTSYVTLREDRHQGSLRSRVVTSIGAEAAGKLRSHDHLPDEATGTLRWWVAAALALGVLVAYAVVSPKNSFQSAGRLIAPLASIDPAKRVSIRDVQPGDIDAIAGRGVEVSASIGGMTADETAWVRWDTRSGARESQLAFHSESRRHIGQIGLEHSVSGQIAYFIHAGDATAGPFYLSVQDVPVVAVESVHYQPPAYTGDLPHTSSSGAMTAVDGTVVTLRATTNRAVTKAKIEFNPRPLGNLIQATAGATELQIDQQGTVLTVSFPLRSARGRSAAVQLESYRIKVWDAAGQSNPEPIIYPVRVIADLPPEVSIVMPRKSPKDLPIDAQQVIEVHAVDADYGLKRVGLEIRSGLDLVGEPTLWSDPIGATGNRVSEYRFRPAEQGLRVGDKVQIIAVAMDNRSVENDPSIEPNVTKTDPIELRIVASEPVPEDPTGADGLSPPDDQPASDKPTGDTKESQASDQGGDAGKQAGGGGSGKGGQSGESAEGQGSSGTGGESSSGNDSPQATGDNPAQSDPSAGGQSTNEATGGKAGGGQGTPSDGSDGSAEPTDGSQQASNNESQSGGQAGDQQSAADGSADAEGQPSPTIDGDPSANGGSAGKPGAQSGQGGGRESASPTHDGEAIERIREYLEQKEKQRASSSEPSKPQQTASGDPTADGKSPSGSQATGSEPERSQDRGSKAGSNGTDASTKGDGTERSAPQADQTGSDSEKAASSETGQREPGGSEQGTAPSDGAPGDRNGENPTGGEESKTGGQSETGGASETGGESETGNASETGGQSETGGGSETGGDDALSGSENGSGSKGQQESGGDSASRSGDESADSSDSAPRDPSQADSGKGGNSADGGRGTSEDTSGQGADGNAADDGKDGSQPNGQPKGDSGDSHKTGASPTQPVSDSGNPAGQPSDPAGQPADGATGSGAGGEGTAAAGDAATPPDPVDLDYAKQATDMVLDYLDQKRDAPDKELLEKLNWTEADLKRFSERWKKVRQLERSATDSDQNREWEEALEEFGSAQADQCDAERA